MIVTIFGDSHTSVLGSNSLVGIHAMSLQGLRMNFAYLGPQLAYTFSSELLKTEKLLRLIDESEKCIF